MRFSSFALVPLLLFLSPRARAAQPIDPVVASGLQAYQDNGLDACLRIWFSDRLDLSAEMRSKVLGATKDLGSVIDTEIVSIQQLSKRVTRYYVAVYYTRCPLWMRVERYANTDKAFILPLKVSINPDEILPGFVTDFLQ
jgi:hypothetical protein